MIMCNVFFEIPARFMWLTYKNLTGVFFCVRDMIFRGECLKRHQVFFALGMETASFDFSSEI